MYFYGNEIDPTFDIEKFKIKDFYHCATQSTHRHKKTPKIDVILFMKLIFKTLEDCDSLKITM